MFNFSPYYYTASLFYQNTSESSSSSLSGLLVSSLIYCLDWGFLLWSSTSSSDLASSLSLSFYLLIDLSGTYPAYLSYPLGRFLAIIEEFDGGSYCYIKSSSSSEFSSGFYPPLAPENPNPLDSPLIFLFLDSASSIQAQ